MLDYPTVTFHIDHVTAVEGNEGNFTIRTESDSTYSAKKLLFTTGVEGIMPDIPSFAEC